MDTVEPFGTPGHLENLLQENMSLSVTNCILNYVLGYSIQIKTFLTHLPTIYCLIVPHTHMCGGSGFLDLLGIASHVLDRPLIRALSPRLPCGQNTAFRAFLSYPLI